MKTQATWWLPTALILICCGVLLTAVACTSSNAKPSSGAFVTVWKGVKDSTLRIPIVGNYTVTWYAADTPNDRHTETVSISQEDAHSFTHPYTFTPPKDGEYVVEVSPEGVEYMRMGGLVRYGTFSTSFESVDTVSFGSALSLLSVLQFGKVRWKSMEAMFAGCSTFNQPLAAWNVSRVTDMNIMFLECTSFNQPLDAWNVSGVVNMEGMFQSSAFNQPLLHWKLNAEVYVFNMFSDCPAAKQPMMAKWKEAGYEL